MQKLFWCKLGATDNWKQRTEKRKRLRKKIGIRKSDAKEKEKRKREEN